MCKCNKGMRNSNGSQMRSQPSGDNVVAIYLNEANPSPMRVFDSIESPTRYLGMARHGYPFSVPRNLVGIERSDGSKFVLPEEFATSALLAVAQKPKVVRKKSNYIPVAVVEQINLINDKATQDE